MASLNDYNYAATAGQAVTITSNSTAVWQSPIAGGITTNSISGSGSITINSGTPIYNTGAGSYSAPVSSSYYGHPYGCSCTSCYPLQYSGTINVSGSGTLVVAPTDEIKSKPKYDEGKHDHVIECRLKVEPTKVISEFFCCHCNEVLHSKVISKIPKSIMNKKCLPRLVKGV